MTRQFIASLTFSLFPNISISDEWQPANKASLTKNVRIQSLSQEERISLLELMKVDEHSVITSLSNSSTSSSSIASSGSSSNGSVQSLSSVSSTSCSSAISADNVRICSFSSMASTFSCINITTPIKRHHRKARKLLTTAPVVPAPTTTATA